MTITYCHFLLTLSGGLLPNNNNHSLIILFIKMKLAFTSLCLLVILLSWEVDVSGADTMMGDSALEKSKHCIEAAREAYDILVENGAPDEAGSVIAHLETLAEDGKYLQKSAEGFLSKLLSQEEGLDQKMKQLQAEKQKLEMEIQASRREKESVEKNHSAKQSVLQDNEKQLQRVQQELQAAEDELHQAKKKAKKKKKGLFGKIKHGLGKLVGHVSSAEKKVKGAKKNLERRRSKLQSVQKAASGAKKALSDVQTKIKQHESKIQATQQQVDAKHKEIGSVKSSIVLLRKSTNFWELFVVAAENAEERTTALKRVVDQAAEQKDYEILREDGTITKAKSFIEAWGIIATDHRIQ